ncbi:MAG: hypothetical protein F4213_03400 [Boseongicola sp. SB0677_bin_26]|nr:hypothetical protein [Boseongicola sp. SB0665_bin_10]MYG25060.1 hypothetical protein [Boseongicola sp. SB0677_bin_26]
MKDSELLLGAVVADLRTGMRIEDVKNLINKHADPASDDVMWQLPKDMDAHDYYRHILHRGVIQEDGTKVTTPIPGFRRWIIENCTAQPAAEAEADPTAILDPYAPPSPFD